MLNEIYIFILQSNLHGFNLSDSIRLNLMGGEQILVKVFSFQYIFIPSYKHKSWKVIVIILVKFWFSYFVHYDQIGVFYYKDTPVLTRFGWIHFQPPIKTSISIHHCYCYWHIIVVIVIDITSLVLLLTYIIVVIVHISC